MSKVDVKEAEKRLSTLIEKASRGEEVIITRGDGADFKIVPTIKETPRPRFGSAKGHVWMSSDFDEPLATFNDYRPS